MAALFASLTGQGSQQPAQGQPGYGNTTQAGATGPGLMGPSAPQQQAPQPMMGPAATGMQGLMGSAQPDASPKSFMQRMVGRVFGDDPSLSAIISPQEAQHNKGTALLQAGLQMMRASSPTDMQHPALTTLGALGAAGQTGLAAYKQAQDESIQNHAIGQQQAVVQGQMAARQRIAQQYAPPDGETPVQEAQRLDNMSAAFATAGLNPEAENVAKAAAALHMRLGYGAAGGAASHIFQGPNGFYTLDPATGKASPLMGPDNKQIGTNQVTAAQRQAKLDAEAAAASTRGAVTADTHDLGYAKGFASNPAVKPYLDRAPILMRASSIVDAVNSTDPDIRKAAMSSLPGAVASMEPQKPVLRAQLYEYMKTIDQSAQGRLKAAFEQTGWGDEPVEQQQMLAKFAKYVASNERQAYTRIYTKFAAARPSAKQYMDPFGPGTIYGDVGAPSGAAPAATGTGAASNVDKFLGR